MDNLAKRLLEKQKSGESSNSLNEIQVNALVQDLLENNFDGHSIDSFWEGIVRSISGVKSLDTESIKELFNDEFMNSISNSKEEDDKAISRSYKEIKKNFIQLIKEVPPTELKNLQSQAKKLKDDIKLLSDEIDTYKQTLNGQNSKDFFTSKIEKEIAEKIKEKKNKFLEKKEKLEEKAESIERILEDVENVKLSKIDKNQFENQLESINKEIKETEKEIEILKTYVTEKGNLTEKARKEESLIREEISKSALDSKNFSQALKELEKEKGQKEKSLKEMIDKIKEEILFMKDFIIKNEKPIKDISEIIKNMSKEEEHIREILEDLADTQDIANFQKEVEELKKKTKSEKWFNVFNTIQGVISGGATALGLSQIIPKILYEAGVVSGAETLNPAIAWGTAGAVGVGVGYLGSKKYRKSIKDGIKRTAMSLKNKNIHPILGNILGNFNGLFLNKKNKFSIARSLLTIGVITAIFGTIKPKKSDSISQQVLNASSVPSTASGITTYFYGDKIQKANQIEFEEALKSGEDLSNDIAKKLHKYSNSVLSSIEEYVDKEKRGDGVNRDDGIGIVANAKNLVLEGEVLNETGTTPVYKKIIEKSSFNNKSLREQITSVQNKYESEIKNQLEVLSPEKATTILDEILDGGNLLKISLDIKELQITTDKNIEDLLGIMKEYQNEIEKITNESIEVLGDIEKESAKNNNKIFDASFLPESPEVDLTELEVIKEEVKNRLTSLEPFIVDIESSLESSSDNPKLLLYGILSVAILLEVLALILFGGFIFTNQRKKYLDMTKELEKKYRSYVTRAKSAGLLPEETDVLPDMNQLFNQGKTGNELVNYVNKMRNIRNKFIANALKKMGGVDRSKHYNVEDFQKNEEKLEKVIDNHWEDGDMYKEGESPDPQVFAQAHMENFENQNNPTAQIKIIDSYLQENNKSRLSKLVNIAEKKRNS